MAWQDIAPVIELLKGPGKRVVDGPNISDSGLVYLQDQSFEFQAREGGRKWSVYGSPVRQAWPHTQKHLINHRAVVARILQLGIWIYAGRAWRGFVNL